MQKIIIVFCFLGLFSVATYAQSNMRTTFSAPKMQNERSITPSKKPLSVKPTTSQPKEEVIEEITIVRTPRRMSPYKSAQAKNEATNPTTNSKANVTDARSINISKQVAMPQE